MRFVAILLFLAQPVFAADVATEPSLLGSSLKMAAGLAVICGILLLLYAASRKGFGVLPQKKDGLIKVLETRPLGGAGNFSVLSKFATKNCCLVLVTIALNV